VLENIHRAYGRAPALSGVTFSVDSAEIVVLVGSNGAGKSTLLIIAAGIMRADSGTVTVNGETRDEKISPLLGYVGHESLLYKALTVRENLVLTGGLRGGQYDVQGALVKWGLAAVADTAVGTLSKGLEARAGIARALLHNPDLIILDEPTNSLDDSSCESLTKDLIDRASRGVAVVIASHDLSRVGPLAKRAIFLDGGVVRSDSRESSVADVFALYRGGNR
jgi:ABC-2 type transport system ATP-binding protein